MGKEKREREGGRVNGREPLPPVAKNNNKQKERCVRLINNNNPKTKVKRIVIQEISN